MCIKIVTLFTILFSSNASFGHGMSTYGPNGGYIKMPGTFHTELVDKESQIHIYLLDINFKKPMVTNSSVKIMYRGQKDVEFSCIQKTDFFACDKPKSGLLNLKTIEINATRDGNKGSNAIYELPLKLK